MTDTTQEPNTEAVAAPAPEPDTTQEPNAPEVPTETPETPAAPAIPPDDYDKSIWEEATESAYVKFDDPAVITFLTSTPHVLPPENGRKGYQFDVFQDVGGKMKSKVLGTRSAGLMRSLDKYSPIRSKRFMITRTGTGKNTTYAVKPL